MTIYRDPSSEVRGLLICSGLDPSGGAGFIADVRAAARFGVRPVGVVTALTVQNTQAVQQVNPVDAEVVGAQLASLLGDVEVHAVKLGLLGSWEIAREIAYGLDLTHAPVVWDPIARPSRGRVDFDAPAFDRMIDLLRPHLTLITPNLDELALLVEHEVTGRDELIAAARELIAKVGDVHVLVKGGHGEGALATDFLVSRDRVDELAGPRIDGADVHGTGCALSTVIAARLAVGDELVDACREAKDFVAGLIAAPVHPGRGAPAVM